MTMSNSKLICYTKLSPNCSKPRNKPIDTISIHCMAGNCSVETCGAIFAPTDRQASSNYGVGSDGRIALYVDEANRSWCTSSTANDNRAITIEVANNGGAPDWPVSDKALAALIDLCTDICKRNGIKQLVWRPDKNNPGNMTVHRWFANKACPGNYLYERHGYIAAEVNKRLGAPKPPEPFKPYTVKVTADELNIRKGHGTNYGTNGAIKDKGVYTIVAESAGDGATKWGKLKSGAGWISLDFCQRR
jgi:hypothetical protein